MYKKKYAEDRGSGIEWPIRNVPIIGGSITIKPKECKGNYVFDPFRVKAVMTLGFCNLFQFPQVASWVAAESCAMIHETFANPDYLQVFLYEREPDGISHTYWVIHDEDYITFLLPEQY